MINNLWSLIVVSVLLIITYLIYFHESSLIKFMIKLKKDLFFNLFYSINEEKNRIDVIRCLFNKWRYILMRYTKKNKMNNEELHREENTKSHYLIILNWIDLISICWSRNIFLSINMSIINISIISRISSSNKSWNR